MSRIKITENEKDQIAPFITKKEIADAAFIKASELIRDAEKELWEEIRKIWPLAVKINHPRDGDWFVHAREK